MMAASIIKILNIMGAKGAAQKLPDKNMGDASELFTGMLACARIAQPAANSDGQRPHAAGKGRCAPLSKNPKTTQLSGLLEKKFTAIPNAGSPKADRRSPGKVNLLPKGHGDTQNKKPPAQIALDPGMMKPDGQAGLQKPKPGIFGKNNTAAKTANLPGETTGRDKKIIPVFQNMGSEQIKSAQKFHAAGDTTGNENLNFETTPIVKARNTGSAGGGKIGINEKMPPAFPNTGPEQSKVAQKFHTAGDTTGNKNTNFEMAGPAKIRTTQSPGGKKNNSVTPSKGDDGTKATRIKMSASNLTGKKIIFEQEKTAVVSPSADTRATLSIKTSGPTHSVDHKLPMGTYLPGPLGPGNKTAVAGDRLRNSGIDARALINQIASQARKPGRVRIALTPPRLGKLDMDVIVRDNKVQVILKTDNNDVCQALKSNTAGLENTLRNQGLMVNTIHVSVQEKPGDHNFGFSQNGNTFKEGSHRENNSRPHRGETDPIEYDLARSPEEKPGVRMDGQVSLFI